MKNVKTTAYSNGCNIIKEQLGDYRTFASQAAHSCKDIDEEKFFQEIVEAFALGIKTEMSKIFGATKTARLLDPFKNGQTKRT